MKNTIKTIAIWVLVGGVFVGFLWLLSKGQASSSTSKNLTESASQLTAVEVFYDFGTISMANGNVSKTFRVSNNTAEDILVKEISTSCMCTTAYIGNGGFKKGPYGMPGHGSSALTRANEKIGAGESRDVEVGFDPNAHGPAGVGTIDRLIYLTDASGGTFQLEIRAEVTP